MLKDAPFPPAPPVRARRPRALLGKKIGGENEILDKGRIQNADLGLNHPV